VKKNGLNPHILRLAEEAGCLDIGGLNGISGSWEFGELELQRFADLIVQSCIIALWTPECQYNEAVRESYIRSAAKINNYWEKDDA